MTGRLRLVTGLVSVALAATGCSGGGDAGSTTEDRRGSTTASAESTTASSASAKAPAGTPRSGAFTGAVAAHLGRTAVPDKEVRGPTGAVGSWKGTPIAVLTKGEDTTLVVREAKTDRWRIVGGWWPSKDLPGPYLGGKRHVLLVGSDARPQERVERSRADAIQLAGLDGKGGGGVLGIPRDTRASLPGGRVGKINAAMPAGGPDAQASTISRMTGIPVQGYFVMSMTGFSATITAMGGVEVTLTRPIRHLKPGTHTLKGPDLLWVARERKSLPRGDIDRSSNQGMVLVAMLSTLRTQGIEKLPALLTKTGRHVTTDLSPAQVLTFLANGYALKPSRVGRVVADTRPAGADLALTAKAKQTFTRFEDGNL